MVDDEIDVSSGEDPHYVPISQEHLGVAAHVVHFSSEACTSGVDFGQIRSIQFCTGDNGHCRSRNNICGMLIRFWDVDHPLTLGQWIREIEGTRIELQRGKTPIETTIWYTQITTMLPPTHQSNHGKVAGIRLVSSKGQVRDIRFGDASSMLCVRY